jgi:hypothetical protein
MLNFKANMNVKRGFKIFIPEQGEISPPSLPFVYVGMSFGGSFDSFPY